MFSQQMDIEALIKEIDQLKAELDRYRPLDNEKVRAALELEYTYESNRIEGNTLTLRETDLVINKGVTIAGKSLQEHLEAINHRDALGYIKDIAQENIELDENVLKDIHSLILRSIDKENAGRYRQVPVMISGSQHLPPQPYLVPKLMENYFEFYNHYKNELHPVILASELHERLVTIHPFIDGNGRTARLVMNLILIRNGYPIANISGDYESRMAYYKALEQVQLDNNRIGFQNYISEIVKKNLERYLKILCG
ncbi:MAG: Fic family protein [Saprospiraceae bacterium]|nr:Fic family protein [Saprospiraceae bacterium]